MRDALTLWRLLYGSHRGYLAILTGRRRDGAKNLQKPATKYFRYPQEAARAAQTSIRSSDSGLETLFCAHLLTGRRRVKQNAAPVTALWADYDAPVGSVEDSTYGMLDVMPEGMPEPSAVVGSSAAGRHLYWKLMRPLKPGRAEALNRRLTYRIGADASGWPLTKLLRVPGTRNHKYEERQEVALRILDQGALYHPRELDLWLPEEQTPVSRMGGGFEAGQEVPAASTATGSPDLSRLSRRVRRLISNGDSGGDYESRSEADFAVCIAMFSAGYDENDVWNVMSDPSNAISERYRDRGRYGISYLVRTIGKARNRATVVHHRAA